MTRETEDRDFDKIPQLRGPGNYDAWATCVKLALQSQGLSSSIVGDDGRPKPDLSPSLAHSLTGVNWEDAAKTRSNDHSQMVNDSSSIPAANVSQETSRDAITANNENMSTIDFAEVPTDPTEKKTDTAMKWEKEDAQASLTIILSLSREIQFEAFTFKKSSAFELWKWLEAKYAPILLTSSLDTCNKLVGLKQEDCGSIGKYNVLFYFYVLRLTRMGKEEIPKMMTVALYLAGLEEGLEDWRRIKLREARVKLPELKGLMKEALHFTSGLRS